MDKNWLIRTKSNHILGPISKEKVLELYHNGSIKPDDEVCSGNGFWFFIREDDMVKRFILGNEVQSFNPVSEAKDILTSKTIKPAPESSQDDITLVNGINVNFEEPVEVKDTPAPKVEPSPRPIPADVKKKVTEAAPALKKQNYLQYLGVIGFIILFLLLYFRKNIIRSLFEGEMVVSVSLIDSAQAQESGDKKKSS